MSSGHALGSGGCFPIHCQEQSEPAAAWNTCSLVPSPIFKTLFSEDTVLLTVNKHTVSKYKYTVR